MLLLIQEYYYGSYNHCYTCLLLLLLIVLASWFCRDKKEMQHLYLYAFNPYISTFIDPSLSIF